MSRPKSLLEMIIENDPELAKLFDQTFKRFQKAAEAEGKKYEEAEFISAEDLAVIIR